MNQNRSFFGKLFDLSFSSFIAPQIVGILYVLGLISAALLGLSSTLSILRFDPVYGVITLLGWLVGLFIFAIFFRVSLESFVAIIRTAENTRILAENVLNNTAGNSPQP